MTAWAQERIAENIEILWNDHTMVGGRERRPIGALNL